MRRRSHEREMAETGTLRVSDIALRVLCGLSWQQIRRILDLESSDGRAERGLINEIERSERG